MSERRSNFHQSIVGRNLPASSTALQQQVSQSAAFLRARGFSPSDALSAAYSHFYGQLQAQARLLAFMDCFHLIGVVTLVAAPLVLLTKYFKIGGSGAAGH
jgi:MFS transporter, DHA2 family, multidrug resistance protein